MLYIIIIISIIISWLVLARKVKTLNNINQAKIKEALKHHPYDEPTGLYLIDSEEDDYM